MKIDREFPFRCECGKWGYSSRKRCREMARKLYPDAVLSVYRCRKSAQWRGDVWHMGNSGEGKRKINPYKERE